MEDEHAHPSSSWLGLCDGNGELNDGSASAELSRYISVQGSFLAIAHTFGNSFVPDLFVGMASRPAHLAEVGERPGITAVPIARNCKAPYRLVIRLTVR
jgi:hypothetical protein